MRIDLWTDPASPDCTQVPEVLGAALARFGATVEVVEHAFEVDRQAPVERRSFDAQRVIALARRDDALDWGGETLAMAAIFGLTYVLLLPLTRALRALRVRPEPAR